MMYSPYCSKCQKPVHLAVDRHNVQDDGTWTCHECWLKERKNKKVKPDKTSRQDFSTWSQFNLDINGEGE